MYTREEFGGRMSGVERGSAGVAKLAIVVPCYNEEAVLPLSQPLFAGELDRMVAAGRISPKSGVIFVDDGSTDATWQAISAFAERDRRFSGIRQSRNRGHQCALWAGLMEARERGFDIAITIDCDGQDDVHAMTEMVDEYAKGADIVYGVRSDRSSDTFFKRLTAEGFYRLQAAMGVETVYNHADYRLLSARAIEALSRFGETNLYLRGLVPLLGFKSAKVFYSRSGRIAGGSHYPFLKMLAFAADGITSLSIKPIRAITLFGALVAFASFAIGLWCFVAWLRGMAVRGWTSEVLCICFFGGMQIFALGIIGEYVGKIYLETKRRPRVIISERTKCGGGGTGEEA